MDSPSEFIYIFNRQHFFATQWNKYAFINLNQLMYELSLSILRIIQKNYLLAHFGISPKSRCNKNTAYPFFQLLLQLA